MADKRNDMRDLADAEKGAEIVLCEPEPYQIKVSVGGTQYTLTDEMLEECTNWSFMGGYVRSSENMIKLAVRMTQLSADKAVEAFGSVNKLEIHMNKAVNTLIAKISKDVNSPLFAMS